MAFTLLSKKPLKDQKTIERFWTGKNGTNPKYNFYKIITGSDKYGLPTFIGEEIFIACMELAHRQHFESKTVYTSKREILDLMNWGHGGLDYKRLMKGLDQLGGVWIKTNAFWDSQSKKYKEVGFGLIQNYMFSEDESFFRWDEIYYDYSLRSGNIKTLDTGVYFSLKSSIAKRLYRYLDKKLYNQQVFEIDLYKLAFEKLEMVAKNKYPSNLMQNLKPAIEELKGRNIADIKIKESKTPSGYKVCFSPISKPQVLVVKEEPRIKMKKLSKVVELVQYFHSFIDPHVKDYEPTKKELQQVSALLIEHGEEKVKYIIEFAVKKAEKTDFKMEFFGAVMGYVDKALSLFHHKKESELKTELKPLPTPSQDISEQILDSWNNALKTLESEMERSKFDTWFGRLLLIDHKDDCFVVFDEYAQESSLFKQKLISVYFPKLENVAGKKVRFADTDS